MTNASDYQSVKLANNGLTGEVASITRFSVYQGPGIRTLVTLANDDPDCEEPDDETTGQTKRGTMTVSSVVEAVMRDQLFYRNSGGGVTIGGVEPAQQAEFVKAILAECRSLGIHTALSTRGCFPEEELESVAHETNLLLLELVHMDPEIQQHYAGCNNEFIWENILQATKIVDQVIVRLPLIAGFNDDTDTIEAIGRFLSEHLANIQQVDLLPNLQDEDSGSNGIRIVYGYDPKAKIDFEKIEQTRAILQSFGMKVYIGG